MSQVRSIAVGYDGTPGAINALRWALYLARISDAELTVLNASGMLGHVPGHYSHVSVPEAVIECAHDAAFNVEKLHWVVSDGDACTVLLHAHEPPISADLLVVGSRAEGKHEGLLLGSTSLEVAQHCTIPVVVVPSIFDAEA